MKLKKEDICSVGMFNLIGRTVRYSIEEYRNLKKIQKQSTIKRNKYLKIRKTRKLDSKERGRLALAEMNIRNYESARSYIFDGKMERHLKGLGFDKINFGMLKRFAAGKISIEKFAVGER